MPLKICLIIALAFACCPSGPAVAQHHHHHHPLPPPPPPPPPPPLTLSISFNPAAPTIPDNTPVLSLITQIIVRVSDGSAFTGSLGFGAPFSNGGGICAIQGREIVLATANPPDGIVNCTVTATQ